MDVLVDQDSKVVAAFLQDARDVELFLAESALDAPESDAVEEDVSFPVDPVEMQELPIGIDMGVESVTVPEGRTELRVRRQELVVGVVGIGDCTGIDIAGKDGAGHSGGHPGPVVERRGRDGRAVQAGSGAQELPGSA